MFVRNRFLYVYLLIAFLIAAFDLTSKWVMTALVMNPPRVIEVTSFFNLVLGFNRGVSFGLLGDLGFWGPIVLSVFAIAIIGLLLNWLRGTGRKPEAVSIAMIIGGAVGNLLDRLYDGAVTDYLDFYFGEVHWPAFNFADSAIFLGVAVLLIGSVRPRGRD